MQNNGMDNSLIAVLGTDFILFCDTMIALFSLYHCYEGALLRLTSWCWTIYVCVPGS